MESGLLTAESLPLALRDALSDLQRDDPFRPVWVLMPSTLSATPMTQYLARHGGISNTRFFSWAHLADAELGRHGAGRPVPLGRELHRELTRRIAIEAGEHFDGTSAAAVEALDAAFHDLRRRSDAELSHIADAGPIAAEAVRLYTIRRHAATHVSDQRDRIEQATALIDDSGPQVVAVVTEPPYSYEIDFLHALRDGGRLTVLPVATGEAVLDDALRISLWGITGTSSTVPDGRRIDAVISAPDAATEVQRDVGELLRHAEAGIPFGRMALLYTADSPYRALIISCLEDAGIPWVGSGHVTLGQTSGGRFILGLFDAVGGHVSLDALGAWWADSPVCNPQTGERVNAAAWVAAMRQARCGRDSSQWASRLTRSTEPEVLAVAASVVAFLSDVVDDERARGAASWTSWARWLEERIRTYLGVDSQRDGWPERDRSAMLDIERAILRLADLDKLGPVEVPAPVFFSAVQEELRAATRNRGANGVTVADVRMAPAAPYDAVIVAGLSEGVFPRRERTDELGAALKVPGEESTTARDRRALALAIGGPGWRACSYAFTDVRRQRAVYPSPLLVALASAKAGEPLEAAALTVASPARPWLTAVPSFAASLTSGIPPNVQLQRVGQMVSLSTPGSEASVHTDRANDSQLARSWSFVSDRDSASLTNADGLVPAGSTAHILDTPLSPTSAEQWATCPYRFFLSKVLGLGSDEPASGDDELAPIDRGSLLHKVLESAVQQRISKVSSDTAWSEGERRAAHEQLDAALVEARIDGVMPGGLLFEADQRDLHEHLDAFFATDSALCDQHDVRVYATEQEVEATVMMVTGAGEAVPVRFRGRIDRIDRSADGSRVVVTDYKTGRQAEWRDSKNNSTDRGRKLQLALYAEAAQALWPASTVHARYWYVTDKSKKYPKQQITYDDAAQAELQNVVGAIANGIQNGVFPAVPGDDDGTDKLKNCQHCAFDAICPVNRDELWERKAADPATGPFHQLAVKP